MALSCEISLTWVPWTLSSLSSFQGGYYISLDFPCISGMSLKAVSWDNPRLISSAFHISGITLFQYLMSSLERYCFISPPFLLSFLNFFLPSFLPHFLPSFSPSLSPFLYSFLPLFIFFLSFVSSFLFCSLLFFQVRRWVQYLLLCLSQVGVPVPSQWLIKWLEYYLAQDFFILVAF